jgi:hypothetical protein
MGGGMGWSLKAASSLKLYTPTVREGYIRVYKPFV